MKPRKNTVKQRQAEIRETEDHEAIQDGLGNHYDHEAEYIAWHKANHTEAEHAQFLEVGIIPTPSK